VLRGLDLRLDQDDRVALLGANGNGKSTLAKVLAGRLPLMAGEQHRAPRLRVGYFAQHQAEELDPGGTPLSHMQAALPKATETQCRAQLARFGLDADRAETAVASCSGGEKARLLLALCTREAPQLLILDEPTNHLDIDARDALVRRLSDYAGAVLLITHDPHLVELVADRLWLVADGHGAALRGRPGRVPRPAGRAGAAGGAAARQDAAPTRRDERRDRAEARGALAPVARTAQARGNHARGAGEGGGHDRRGAGRPAPLRPRQPRPPRPRHARRAAIAREVEALETEWLELQGRLEDAA
jgi:ATP-binding cassette subfamily F protein 3